MSSTEEKMTQETTKIGENQFYGGEFMHREEDKKECAVIGLIKNKLIVLGEEYSAAKEDYATANLKDKYSPANYEAEFKCRMLEAKMNVVKELQTDFENMLSPMPTSMALAV